MGWVKLQDINFLALQSAVFCVQCELISENNTPACLACGSQAVLSLSRVLGGSLRGQQTANVIADAELNRLVRDLLRTVSESCTAPDLGVRLQTDSGISADCVRTGEVVLCNDADRNPCVDLSSCRRLGVRSILAAPLCHFRRTLGVFEVLSSAPHAFDGRDVATMQMLSSVMVAAMSRLSNDRPARNSA